MLEPRLPQAEDVEKAVLACFLMDPDLVGAYGATLGDGCFYSKAHRLVYQAMMELSMAGRRVDVQTVVERLRSTDHLEEAGGVAAVANLDEALPDPTSIESYLRVLQEKAARRRLVEAAVRLAANAGDESVPLEDIYASTQRSLDLAAEDGAGSEDGWVSSTELMAKSLVVLGRDGRGKPGGVSSGFDCYDEVTGGFHRAEMVILAGRPSMGKTTLALQMLVAAARTSGETAALVSLEMSGSQLSWRLLSQESHVHHGKITRSGLDEFGTKAVRLAAGRLSEVPFHVEDQPTMSVDQIAARARQLKAKRGLRILLVDHLGLIQHRREKGWNRAQQVGDTSKALKRLARSLDITVVALSQLNRNVDERGDKVPMLSDLRDTGDIEQDADVVVFVYRPEVYWPNDPAKQGYAHLIFAKVRDGRAGDTPKLHFDGDRMQFREWGSQDARQHRIGGA